jgi:CRP-like cAMP-binding protein
MATREQNAQDHVAAYGWLAACTPGFRDWVLGSIVWRSYAAGEGVTHAGDAADDGAAALYCIGDGQVHFVAGIGMADVGTSYFGLPGVWWGHAPLLGGGRIGSTVASCDTLCGAIRLSALRARLESHPGDWQNIATALADLFFVSAGAHADLLIADSTRRVAATILRLGGWRHRMYRLDPPASFVCTHEHLAGAAAFSRNTVGRIVRDFEAAGLVDARYGRVAILDAKRLRAVANAV